MPDQVKVEDIEVFALFRVAMLKFAQAASSALSNADSHISRTHSWLEGEQRTYWEGQLRKRMEAVTNAREALRQKKMYKDVSGRMPSCDEEEKVVRRCLAAVEHAKDRIESIRKALPQLEKAAGVYRSGVSSLSKTVTDDIPKAVALLDRLASSLEQYIQIEAVAGASQSSSDSTSEASISRGGDSTADAPSPKEVAPATTAADRSPPPQQGSTSAAISPEGRNVAVGQ